MANSIIVAGTDIETTGLEQEKGHRIIEISLDLYKSTDGLEFVSMGPVWTRRINPLRPIDPAAEHVHKISLSDLRGEPEWDEVAPELTKLLSRCDLVVGHNGEGFDFPFIGLELIRIGHDIPSFEIFDTMLQGRSATGMGKVPNLGELCFAFGIDYDPAVAHAAEYDTKKMMECFFTGLRWGVFEHDLITHFKNKGEMAA